MDIYCGSMGVQPPDQTTSKNMNIRFVSDEFFVGTGFNLTYKAFRRKCLNTVAVPIDMVCIVVRREVSG